LLRNILLLLAAVSIVSSDSSWPQLKVNISSLGIVQGEINPLVNNVRQFIGIPFAQPPIGALRFKPPVPLNNSLSSNIYNATAAAHQGGFPWFDCIQVALLNSSVIYGQEDCLYLDIFLPLNISAGSLLPVVTYIYGGGFKTSDPHDPSQLISLYQNVIYVSIRYRINVFGFMASTALSASRSGSIQSSGLQGFEDQQMAIKWVQNNIQCQYDLNNIFD
jgi:carboxylesterase type B